MKTEREMLSPKQSCPFLSHIWKHISNEILSGSKKNSFAQNSERNRKSVRDTRTCWHPSPQLENFCTSTGPQTQSGTCFWGMLSRMKRRRAPCQRQPKWLHDSFITQAFVRYLKTQVPYLQISLMVLPNRVHTTQASDIKRTLLEPLKQIPKTIFSYHIRHLACSYATAFSERNTDLSNKMVPQKLLCSTLVFQKRRTESLTATAANSWRLKCRVCSFDEPENRQCNYFHKLKTSQTTFHIGQMLALL